MYCRLKFSAKLISIWSNASGEIVDVGGRRWMIGTMVTFSPITDYLIHHLIGEPAARNLLKQSMINLALTFNELRKQMLHVMFLSAVCND